MASVRHVVRVPTAVGPSTAGPSTVGRRAQPLVEVPMDLEDPGLHASGLDSDGWLANDASFDLRRPDASVTIVVRGQVPLINDPEFKTELTMLVDGKEFARQTVGIGRFRVSAEVPAGQDSW